MHKDTLPKEPSLKSKTLLLSSLLLCIASVGIEIFLWKRSWNAPDLSLCLWVGRELIYSPLSSDWSVTIQNYISFISYANHVFCPNFICDTFHIWCEWHFLWSKISWVTYLDETVVMHTTSGRMAIVKEKTIMKRVWARFLSFFFWFSNCWIEFIDKQPMKAGQGLKSSLATQKHRKKWHTYTQMKQ